MPEPIFQIPYGIFARQAGMTPPAPPAPAPASTAGGIDAMLGRMGIPFQNFNTNPQTAQILAALYSSTPGVGQPRPPIPQPRPPVIETVPPPPAPTLVATPPQPRPVPGAETGTSFWDAMAEPMRNAQAQAATQGGGEEQSAESYEVQAGDSLWKIAEQLLGSGARWTEIQHLNGLQDTIIHPGDMLQLPTGPAPANPPEPLGLPEAVPAEPEATSERATPVRDWLHNRKTPILDFLFGADRQRVF